MDQINIKANVDQRDISICRFIVDRSVYEGSAVYNNKDAAKSNKLAEKIFEIPGVVKVELADTLVSVTKNTDDDWRQVGRRVGSSIRAVLQPPPDIPEGDLLPIGVLREKIQEFLEAQINPMVASHGGFIELIDVDTHIAYVRMGGGCQGCGAANMTLKAGVERMMRDAIPQITQVLDTTDHAAGSNPYYSPSK